MKHSPFPVLLVVALLVCALPKPQVNSQAAAFPTDPLEAIQALQTANDDLIKRQEATLKDLSDITADAHEVRIYTKRG